MGGAVSTGDDNDELVDNLVDADYIKTMKIERIFRAVDRANYFLPDHAESAYKDLAWKHGHLHLSAPCIYSEVLESLELEAGQSFLNLGSGTGYLSTMAGLILGAYGANHGVEIHDDVVDYAREKLEEFKSKTKAFEEFDFCEPQFVVGNCLQLNSACRLYDRVYCGAACPAEHENYMKNLIKLGGILVMPLSDQLLQIRRVGETEWVSRNVLPVSFATLQSPSKEKTDVVDLPECHVLSLQEVCRHNIRSIIRSKICAEIPDILRPKRKQRPPKPKRTIGRRGHLVNLVPMQMGMMILNNFNDSSDDIDDEEDEDIKLANDSGPLKTSDDELNDAEDDVEDDDDEGNVSANEEESGSAVPTFASSTASRPSDRSEQNSKRKLRQDSIMEESEREAATEALNNGLDMDDKKVLESKPNIYSTSTDNKRSSPSSFCEDWQEESGCGSKRMRCVDMQDGGKRDTEETKENETSNLRSSQGEERSRQPQRELSSEDSDVDSMDVDSLRAAFQAPPTPTSVLNALHLLSIPRKVRCSSSNSADTSETSGFGSFGDEPLDLPGLSVDRDSPPSVTTDAGFRHSIVGDRGSPPSMHADGNSPRCVEESALEAFASLGKKATSAKTSNDSDTSGESSTGPDQYDGPTLGQLMKEHIQGLPLPLALRSYLTYYRN